MLNGPPKTANLIH